MAAICETQVSTRLGAFTIRSSERGVREISFSAGENADRNGRRNSGAKPAAANRASEGRESAAQSRKWAKQAARELREYAAGERTKFTVPLDLDGTAFQRRVWKALCSIPYGQTRSYGEIARQVGSPRAARAVGMANHDNPVCIVVPCHRVIAGDGSLGGYAVGLKTKSAILDLEKAHA